MIFTRRTSRRLELGAAAVVLLSLSPLTPVASGTSAADMVVESPNSTTRTVRFSDTVSDAATVNRKAAITVSAPVSVVLGTRLAVTGVVRVQTGRARPVRLLELTSSGWTSRATRTSKGTGRFRIEIGAGSLHRTRTFQVIAPKVSSLAEARTSRLRVDVTDESAPATTTPTGSAALGLADDWSFMFPNGGARWNPCAPIRWAYNPTGGYAGSLTHVTEAFARIAHHTGLTFSYVGETSHVQGTGTTFPTDADIAIGWADETRVDLLSGGVVGVGGGSVTDAPTGRDVTQELVRSFVVLDQDHALKQGFATSGQTTWGQVMVHEVLHALGLGHAAGAEQVMHGAASSLNHVFGAGDITGMQRIGAGQGCL